MDIKFSARKRRSIQKSTNVVIMSYLGNNHCKHENQWMEDMTVKLLTALQVMELINSQPNYCCPPEKKGKPIGKSQVIREIRDGYIKGELIGGRYLVKETALKNYVRRHPGVAGKKEMNYNQWENEIVKFVENILSKKKYDPGSPQFNFQQSIINAIKIYKEQIKADNDNEKISKDN